MSEALSAVSFEAFLEAEQRSDVRHELVGGLVYARPDGTRRHDLAARWM